MAKDLKKDDRVWLHVPHYGYQGCSVTGERDGYRWQLKVIGSGDIIYRYDDEFDYD